MLIHGRIDQSTVNGPGRRAVLWVAGCGLGCPGCWNPDTHAFDNSKATFLSDLEDWVLSLKDIDGITFSGGEPMQQAPYLLLLCQFIREKRPELSIGMFTGYSLKELEDGRWKWRSDYNAEWVRGSREVWLEIKKHLDFAILGRYVEKLQDTQRPLCGSTNQQVEFFSDRYEAKDLSPQEVEVTLDGDLVQITGFPVGLDPDSLIQPPLEMPAPMSKPKSNEGSDGELVSA